MINQITIKSLKEDNLLIFTFGDRDVSITLTDQLVDALTDILVQYKETNQGKSQIIYSENLN